MIFEFGEYCFIKWKFKFWNFLVKFELKDFRSVESFARSNEIIKKIILKSLDDSISIRFLFGHEFWSIERNSWPIKTHKTEFSVEFSSDYSKSLKRFQALWRVLWNILTLHTCSLMKYKPMGITRGLCSLEK